MTGGRLVIIPARGGSKGLPGKNLAKIAGETLLARAVRCARESQQFAAIMVSTDDPAIAEEGMRAGAEVPFLRPAALASDTSNILDAIRDALSKLSDRQFSTIALLEPTSPLRTPEIVGKTLAAAEMEATDSAFTVSRVPLKFHPLKQFFADANGFAAFALPEGKKIVNRQELQPSWIRNGMCYAARREAIEAGLGFTGGRVRLVPVEGLAINIDDAEDLAAARSILEAGLPPSR